MEPRGLQPVVGLPSRQRERSRGAHALEPRLAPTPTFWDEASAARSRPLVSLAGRVAAADAESVAAHGPRPRASLAAALLARKVPGASPRMASGAQRRRASGCALARKWAEGLVAMRQRPRVEGCHLYPDCTAHGLSVLLGAPRGARTIPGCAAAGARARMAFREERSAHPARRDDDEQSRRLVAMRRVLRARMASGGG